MKKRYSLAAIFLHWIMALMFLVMFVAGYLMTSNLLEQYLQFQMYQWHKALGVIVFLLVFVRLITRLFSTKPKPIEGMTPLEEKASTLGHWSLYAMMFLMPLSGWVMVSASPFGLPTIVFGLFEWPHLPYMEANESIETTAKTLHEIFSYLFVILIAGHILMVVKHWLFDGQNLLPRIGIGKTQ